MLAVRLYGNISLKIIAESLLWQSIILHFYPYLKEKKSFLPWPTTTIRLLMHRKSHKQHQPVPKQIRQSNLSQKSFNLKQSKIMSNNLLFKPKLSMPLSNRNKKPNKLKNNKNYPLRPQNLRKIKKFIFKVTFLLYSGNIKLNSGIHYWEVKIDKLNTNK